MGVGGIAQIMTKYALKQYKNNQKVVKKWKTQQKCTNCTKAKLLLNKKFTNLFTQSINYTTTTMLYLKAFTSVIKINYTKDTTKLTDNL